MNLTEMRDRVRIDLRDEDSANYRWTDGDLNRHFERATRELSLAAPLEAVATLAASPGSRDLSIAGLTDLVGIEAVEFPVGQYPASYVRYSVWLNTLTLLIDHTPESAADVAVYYTKMHTIDGSTSTIPVRFEEVVAGGAAGFAAVEWSSFATNRVNVGGQDVWREYLAWGQERLAEFQRYLARHGRRNALRVRRMYAPAAAPVDQSTVKGP